jgi:hypothetical protein
MVALQAGHKVRWLDEARSGTVQTVRPDGSVDVMDADGMLWPAQNVRKLVAVGKVKSATPTPEPAATPSVKEERTAPLPVATKVERVLCPSLAIAVPDPENVLGQSLTLWAVNPGALHMYLVVSVFDGDEHQLVWNGELAANTQIDLRRFTGDDLGYLTELRAEAVFFHPLGYTAVQPVCITVRLGGTRLMKAGAYVRVAGLDEPAMLFSLENEPVRPVVPTPAPAPQGTKSRADSLNALTRKEPRVDLHLEKIPGDHSRLTDHEKLTVQMRLCQQHLDAAIKDHLPSIVFIHGKGKGRLREEVQKLAALHGLNCTLLPNAGETRVFMM